MFLHDSIFLYIVSLFHSKFRQGAIFSLEITNAVVIILLSLALFDHILKDTDCDFDHYRSSAVHDNFSDLVTYLNTPRTNNESDLPIFESVIIPYVFNTSDNPTLAEVNGIELRDDATSFQKFQLNFRKQEMYQEGDRMVDELLYDLATWPIESIETYRGGTQIKMYVNFTYNAGRAMMKPMKCSREEQTLPNRYMFRDIERHNAEIAAFHLDRALGFRRAAPVAGRKLNITSEILEICDNDLRETFFESPDNKKCFHGYNCSQYCNIMHPICGNPEIIEVAMMAFMPFFNKSDEKHFQNPWRRAYHVRKKAEWTKDDDWCDYVQLEETYYSGTRRILDVIDMHVLDFLMTNQDRHHYESLLAFGAEANSTASIIHLDHGRSFGRAFSDDHVILTPIRQCCLIRNTTLATLLRYHNGPVKLSEHMRKSMINDHLAPVLWEPHYEALDRRVGLILQEIRNCIEKTVPAKRLKYDSDEPAIDHNDYKPGDIESDSISKENKNVLEQMNSKSIVVSESGIKPDHKVRKVAKKIIPIDKNKEVEMDKELQVNVVENKDQGGINQSEFNSYSQSND